MPSRCSKGEKCRANGEVQGLGRRTNRDGVPPLVRGGVVTGDSPSLGSGPKCGGQVGTTPA